MSLRAYLDRIEPNFHPGGKYQKFYALYEAVDTIFYAPGTTTKSTAHVRDGIDLKRIMITVWFCTFPAIFFGAFFLGQNASEAIAAGAIAPDGLRGALALNIGTTHRPGRIWSMVSLFSCQFMQRYSSSVVFGKCCLPQFAGMR